MSDVLRIIPLGGLGEVGKNMTAFEYGEEILVVDAGIMFPENDMLGVDFIIPDYKYLKDRKEKVRAILVTHGHEDHVGALGHFISDINVPIYATPLTIGLIEVKLREAGVLNDTTLRTIQAGMNFRIGSFNIEPFHVAHSIPDCVGFGITTPVGLIVLTGDYKFDHTPVDGWAPDFAKLAEFSRRGVLALLADSTNAEQPGWTPSERVITAAFDDLFRRATGRIIVATFASLISRIQQVAEAAVKYGRKLVITGRSMRENVKMATRLGYLRIPDDLLIDINQAGRLPANQVVVMSTGAQGEPASVLVKLATGRHRNLVIEEGDTVVLSAHPIPGNEEMIHRTINRLFQRGANVLYDQIAQVHVSGHASQEEMKLMINLIRPKFLIPVHGELRHLKKHADLARGLGIPAGNITVIENGTILELTHDSLTIGPRIPGGYVYVDGSSVGDIGPGIMRDRELLGNNGFVVVQLRLDSQGQLVGRPNMITRGFIDQKEVAELLPSLEENVVQTTVLMPNDPNQWSNRLEESLKRFFYSETGRRPLVFVLIK